MVEVVQNVFEHGVYFCTQTIPVGTAMAVHRPPELECQDIALSQLNVLSWQLSKDT